MHNTILSAYFRYMATCGKKYFSYTDEKRTSSLIDLHFSTQHNYIIGDIRIINKEHLWEYFKLEHRKQITERKRDFRGRPAEGVFYVNIS